MRILFAFLLMLLPASAFAAEPALYYVPPGQLNVSMQVMKLGLSNVTALFGIATGSFHYDTQAKTLNTLRAAIDTTSIVSNTTDNQTALSNLLGATQYPEIRFTALDNVTFADGNASIKGTLTVHGVSKPASFDATLNSASPNAFPGANDEVGISLHGTFKRADFGITDDPEMPAIFGDTITLQLEMQAIKQ